jgi:hypothetical protein
MATTWTADLMSKDTFSYDVEKIEPDGLKRGHLKYTISCLACHGLVAEEPL